MYMNGLNNLLPFNMSQLCINGMPNMLTGSFDNSIGFTAPWDNNQFAGPWGNQLFSPDYNNCPHLNFSLPNSNSNPYNNIGAGFGSYIPNPAEKLRVEEARKQRELERQQEKLTQDIQTVEEEKQTAEENTQTAETNKTKVTEALTAATASVEKAEKLSEPSKLAHLTWGEKSKAMCTGIAKSAKGMFCDEKGFSWKRTLTTVAVGALTAGVIAATGGAATPFVLAAGGAIAAYQLGKGGLALWNNTARSKEEQQQAWGDVGAGGLGLLLTGLGFKGYKASQARQANELATKLTNANSTTPAVPAAQSGGSATTQSIDKNSLINTAIANIKNRNGDTQQALRQIIDLADDGSDLANAAKAALAPRTSGITLTETQKNALKNIDKNIEQATNIHTISRTEVLNILQTELSKINNNSALKVATEQAITALEQGPGVWANIKTAGNNILTNITSEPVLFAGTAVYGATTASNGHNAIERMTKEVLEEQQRQEDLSAEQTKAEENTAALCALLQEACPALDIEFDLAQAEGIEYIKSKAEEVNKKYAEFIKENKEVTKQTKEKIKDLNNELNKLKRKRSKHNS